MAQLLAQQNWRQNKMAIFINSDSKVIVQGMTGSEGTKHTKRMLKAGTKVVGGVTPGKGGQSVDMDGTNLPVFNTVAEAMAAGVPVVVTDKVNIWPQIVKNAAPVTSGVLKQE